MPAPLECTHQHSAQKVINSHCLGRKGAVHFLIKANSTLFFKHFFLVAQFWLKRDTTEA